MKYANNKNIRVPSLKWRGAGFPRDAKHEIDMFNLRLPMVTVIFITKNFIAALLIGA